MLYAVEGASGIFSELGQGGAAVVNGQSGLSWGSGADHPPELYVHVVNQTELNARINSLIAELMRRDHEVTDIVADE